jgi:hypothetical protein
MIILLNLMYCVTAIAAGSRYSGCRYVSFGTIIFHFRVICKVIIAKLVKFFFQHQKHIFRLRSLIFSLFNEFSNSLFILQSLSIVLKSKSRKQKDRVLCDMICIKLNNSNTKRLICLAISSFKLSLNSNATK